MSISTHIISKIKKAAPPPRWFNIAGNVRVTTKLALQSATIAIDIALLRILFGKISDITTQLTGPREAAKEAMYVRIKKKIT